MCNVHVMMLFSEDALKGEKRIEVQPHPLQPLRLSRTTKMAMSQQIYSAGTSRSAYPNPLVATQLLSYSAERLDIVATHNRYTGSAIMTQSTYCVCKILNLRTRNKGQQRLAMRVRGKWFVSRACQKTTEYMSEFEKKNVRTHYLHELTLWTQTPTSLYE